MADTEDPAAEAKSPAPAGEQMESSRSIVMRWKREDLLRRGSLALRVLALCFSLLAFIVMACNRHGNQYDWRNFDKYPEFRYLLAISVLSSLYSGGQLLLKLHQFKTGNQILPPRTLTSIDFFGDQTMAYLLISASSAAIPMTNSMRENVDNIFTDSLAASTSMAFLAFAVLAVSAGISGYKLSTQSYI